MKDVYLHRNDWSNVIGYYCKGMQNVVGRNSFGLVEVARSYFLFLVWLEPERRC